MPQPVKIALFVRAYNDIDHFTPIAYKLLQRSDVEKVVFYNSGLDTCFKNDYRVNFLRTFGNRFEYHDLIERLSFSKRLTIKAILSVINLVTKIPRIGRSIYARLDNHITHMENNLDLQSLIKEDLSQQIVLFDHIFSDFSTKNLAILKAKGAPIALLPHGVDPTDNLIMSSKELFPQRHPSATKMNQFIDIFYVNNQRYLEKCLSKGLSADILKSLGSARFAYEWSEKLKEIVPKHQKPLPQAKVKVVMMLSKWNYNNWKEETIRIAKTISCMDDVCLVVKPHTRDMTFRVIEQKKNVFVDNENEYHSRELVEWCDLMLFSISSIFLDALLLDKPALHMRLTTSNKMEFRDIVKNWNIDCRDDLIEWLEKFKKAPQTRTYTPQERRDCLDLYVQDNDGKLLDRYVDDIMALRDKIPNKPSS